MRGRAQRWIKLFLGRYLADPKAKANGDVRMWMEDLDYFMVEIRRVFGPSNEESTATRVIQHLTQKKSAAEYSAQFQEYADKTGWDDTALMTHYRRGLKKNVKEELMRTERNTSST